MPRRQVVEIDCDRCDRKEIRPVIIGIDFASGPDRTGYTVVKDGKVFAAVLVDEGNPPMEVVFEELCTPCKETIRKHLDAIKRKIQKASPKRAPSTPATVATPDFGARKKAQGNP